MHLLLIREHEARAAVEDVRSRSQCGFRTGHVRDRARLDPIHAIVVGVEYLPVALPDQVGDALGVGQQLRRGFIGRQRRLVDWLFRKLRVGPEFEAAYVVGCADRDRRVALDFETAIDQEAVVAGR